MAVEASAGSLVAETQVRQTQCSGIAASPVGAQTIISCHTYIACCDSCLANQSAVHEHTAHGQQSGSLATRTGVHAASCWLVRIMAHAYTSCTAQQLHAPKSTHTRTYSIACKRWYCKTHIARIHVSPQPHIKLIQQQHTVNHCCCASA
jgi:hypothetical protein